MSDTIGDSSLAFETTQETPKIRFLASLSDGRTVVQDYRPKKRNAWVRLAVWLKSNPGIYITNMRLQGPNGVDITMPPNQDGYFFGHKSSAVWLGPQIDCVGIGYFDGQLVNISWYKQPNLCDVTTEERTPGEAGFFLIRK